MTNQRITPPAVRACPCPKCGEAQVSVLDTRPTGQHFGWSIRRRRHCHGCGHRFTTWEVTHEALMDIERQSEFSALTKEQRATLREVADVLWGAA